MGLYTLAQAKDRLSQLVDAALAGEQVTITRDGIAAVQLLPSRQIAIPMTPADIAEMARKRGARPRLAQDAIALVRALRDERE